MLKQPYERDELERLFCVELAALKDLLSPAIENFAKCCYVFREMGFVADEPYRALLQIAARGEIGTACRAQLARGDPEQVSLADFIQLYPNRMLQFMAGWPTPRVTYLACLGDAVYNEMRSAQVAALKARWSAFAVEANRYPHSPLPAETRDGIIEAVFKASLGSAGFTNFPISRASVRKWHPQPSWVDAAVGVLRDDRVDVVLVGQTPRPRKYSVLPNFSSEPDELDTGFDQIEVSLWAVPKREIPGLSSAALGIRQILFNYYWDFYSLKGLRRIVDAHVAAASVILHRP